MPHVPKHHFGLCLLVLLSACGGQKGEKKTVDPVTEDRMPPRFAALPQTEEIGTDSASLVFSYNEKVTGAAVISTNTGLSLTHDEIMHGGDQFAHEAKAFESTRIRFSKLKP